jgi:hypothetical protein
MKNDGNRRYRRSLPFLAGHIVLALVVRSGGWQPPVGWTMRSGERGGRAVRIRAATIRPVPHTSAGRGNDNLKACGGGDKGRRLGAVCRRGFRGGAA